MNDAVQRLASALRAARRAAVVAVVPFVVAAGCTAGQAGDVALNEAPGAPSVAPSVGSAAVESMSRLPDERLDLRLKKPGFHYGLSPDGFVPDAICNNNGATAGYGDGSDGPFAPAVSAAWASPDTTVTAAAGGTTLTVGSSAGFAVDNLVLIHQTQGINAGTWETARVTAVGAGALTVAEPLLAAYTVGAQVVKVPQFTTVTIKAGVTITAPAWTGAVSAGGTGIGGILAFVATGTVSVSGNISADAKGFQGGPGDGGNNGCGGVPPNGGFAGESSLGAGTRATVANGTGGGGGGTLLSFCCSNCPPIPGTTGDSGGGGGGYGTAGATGQGSAQPGVGGATIGATDLSTIFFGGGGGGGGGNCGASSPAGGAGGGIVLVSAPTVTVAATGKITARGAISTINAPGNWEGSGGGGAGGAIVVSTATATLAADTVDASGGPSSVQCAGTGGAGGSGLVRLACGTLNGTTCPTSAGADVVPAPDVTAFCAFSTCTSSTECPAATPACSPTSRLCVQCVANTDCALNANGPLCDTTKDTCGTCTSSVTAACVGTTPICNTTGTNDVCAACNGNNGSAATLPCPTPGAPICVTTGSSTGACVQCTDATTCSGTTPVCSTLDACVACNGDNGTSATQACPSSAAPYCNGDGSCGVCTTDAQCVGHAGPFCNTATGACGATCFTDAECGAGNWCDNLSGPGICQPQTSNGQPVPGGTCTSTLGARACLSSVCDTKDNDCGYANGDGPCTGGDGTLVCRSTICATDIGLCEQCTSASTCAAATPVCDATTFRCVVCNGDNGMSVSDPCPSSTAPTCTAGQCGKCTSDAQCGAGHAGNFCNTTTGTCGSSCTTDAQCGAGNWCNNLSGPGSCQPQTNNGLPVPGGTCTTTIGGRACVSGVCDTKDNDCGYANGDGPCTGTNGGTVCRSSLCATTGAESGLCVQCETSAQCSGATPVCDPTLDACVPCNGDDGTATPDPCSFSVNPTCNLLAGTCGKCTNDTQCGPGHAGAFCNTTTGSCGNSCTTDAECGAGNWCDDLSGPGFCQPKTNNGFPVPGGTCTTTIGGRACLSTVCDTDNACGYRNGDGPCATSDDPTKCRSTICATSGTNSGDCVECLTDADCAGTLTPVCNTTTNTCVLGSNGGGDAGVGDGGATDAGTTDAGTTDAGAPDSGTKDSGSGTGGDSGATDSGAKDSGSGTGGDSGATDSGAKDSGSGTGGDSGSGDSGLGDGGATADAGDAGGGEDAGDAGVAKDGGQSGDGGVLADSGSDGSVGAPDSGPEGDAAFPSEAGSVGADEGLSVGGGGCSCRTQGTKENGSDGAMFAGFALLVLAHRRGKRGREGRRPTRREGGRTTQP